MKVIIFLISFMVCLPFIYREGTDIHELILYPDMFFLNMLSSFKRLNVESVMVLNSNL